MNFRQQNSLRKRVTLATRILTNYPDRVPIIVEPYQDPLRDLPRIKRTKFLAPKNVTFGAFCSQIRDFIELPVHETIYFSIDDKIPHQSLLIGIIYQRYKKGDFFLYINYHLENVFG